MSEQYYFGSNKEQTLNVELCPSNFPLPLPKIMVY